MPVIYLDVLVAVNWLIDYLLLSATSYILRLPTRHWRLVLSSFVGSISSCLIFLTSVPTVAILVLHFVCACILIMTAFPFSKVAVFFKQTIVFYVISALFSGIISALWSVTKSETFYAYNGVVYFDISPLLLAALAVISYALIRIYEYVTRKKAPESHEFQLRIDDGNGVCECRALYDTGMHLAEPFSGRPVVIVEQSVLEPFLSAEMTEVLCCPMAKNASVMYTRVRMIPYHSLGSEGLLPAFVPHKLTISALKEKERDISGTYIALSKGLGRGDYQALIGSDTVGKG